MKKQILFLFVLVFLVFITNQMQAMQNQSFAWSASADTNVTGYYLYYGNASGNYSTKVDVGNNLSGTITSLQPATTYYFVVTSHDSSGNESAPSFEISIAIPVTISPVLNSIATQVVNMQQPLSLLARASDANPAAAGHLTFSLSPGTPSGMTINAASGALYWAPSVTQAGTTNHIVVNVSDNSTPPMTASQVFTVIVPHMAQVSLSSAVVGVGQAGTIDATLTSSGPVTNLTFMLEAPVGWVDSMTVKSLLPDVAVITQDPVGGIQSLVTIQTTNGQALQGVHDIVRIYLTATRRQPSNFRVMCATSVCAWMKGAQAVPNTWGMNSKLVIVGAQSLMEAQVNNGSHDLVLYGPAGTRYQIESTTSLAHPVWTTEMFTALTNLSQVIPSVSVGSTAMKFYRAHAY